MCRSFSLREPPTCRLGLHLHKTEPPRAAETGIFTSIASRIRQWLQSKRRYEVSPVKETAGGDRLDKPNGAEGEAASVNGNTLRTEAIKEDYLIISHINNYHPELRRSEASRGFSIGVSKSSSAIASSGRNSGTNTPLISKLFTHDKSVPNSNAHKKPVVDINIEFADQIPAPEPRSHFISNPLKLNQNHTSKTSIMTPATRALSRSQQLRQSRNKYMKLLQKTGQLSPGR